VSCGKLYVVAGTPLDGPYGCSRNPLAMIDNFAGTRKTIGDRPTICSTKIDVLT